LGAAIAQEKFYQIKDFDLVQGEEAQYSWEIIAYVLFSYLLPLREDFFGPSASRSANYNVQYLENSELASDPFIITDTKLIATKLFQNFVTTGFLHTTRTEGLDAIDMKDPRRSKQRLENYATPSDRHMRHTLYHPHIVTHI